MVTSHFSLEMLIHYTQRLYRAQNWHLLPRPDSPAHDVLESHQSHCFAILSLPPDSETRLLIFSSDPFWSHPAHLSCGHSCLSRPSAQKPSLTPFLFFLIVHIQFVRKFCCLFKTYSRSNLFSSLHHYTPAWATITPSRWVTVKTPRGSPCLCPSTSVSVFNPTARMITQITSPGWPHHQGDHISSHQPLLCWEPYSGFLVHSRENCRICLHSSFSDHLLSTPWSRHICCLAAPVYSRNVYLPAWNMLLQMIVPHALPLFTQTSLSRTLTCQKKTPGSI